MSDFIAGDPARLRAETVWLERLAKSLVRSSEDAQDLVQETWLARIRAGEGLEDPSGWLATVARNFARRKWREEQRRSRRHQQIEALALGSSPSSEDLLARHEAQRVLMNLVSELKEPYRSTVLLRYAEDLSPAEIGQAAAASSGHRALAPEDRTRRTPTTGGTSDLAGTDESLCAP